MRLKRVAQRATVEAQFPFRKLTNVPGVFTRSLCIHTFLVYAYVPGVSTCCPMDFVDCGQILLVSSIGWYSSLLWLIAPKGAEALMQLMLSSSILCHLRHSLHALPMLFISAPVSFSIHFLIHSINNSTIPGASFGEFPNCFELNQRSRLTAAFSVSLYYISTRVRASYHLGWVILFSFVFRLVKLFS